MGTDTQLTLAEETTLADLEAIVQRNRWAFVQVANALAEIRFRRLYRANYSSFEAYCRERWGWGRKIASDYILAAGVVENVTSTLHSPIFLTQARILAPLEPEQQREVASSVDFATTTVKQVKQRVDEVRNPTANGTVVKAPAVVGNVTSTLLSPRGDILPSATEEPRPELGISMVRAGDLCQMCRERLFPQESPKRDFFVDVEPTPDQTPVLPEAPEIPRSTKNHQDSTGASGTSGRNENRSASRDSVQEGGEHSSAETPPQPLPYGEYFIECLKSGERALSREKYEELLRADGRPQ